MKIFTGFDKQTKISMQEVKTGNHLIIFLRYNQFWAISLVQKWHI